MRKLILGTVVGAALIAAGAAAIARPDGHGADPKPASTPKPAVQCGEGALPEIKDLAWMAGKWDVTVKWISPEGKAFPAPTESLIEPMLDGCFLKETITVPMWQSKNPMVGIRSYDQFRKTYRLVWFDSLIALADIYEGSMADGALMLTNLKSGTSYAPPGGPENFVRITQKNGASHDEFGLTWEASSDKGQTWRKTCEYAYKRKP